jgi:Universal stress protein family
VHSAFEQVTRQLAMSPLITVETVTLYGDAAHEVLQFASRVGADLIAAGSHGYGFFSRLLLGSVATKLLRGATCAVLGVPLTSIPTTEREELQKGERTDLMAGAESEMSVGATTR